MEKEQLLGNLGEIAKKHGKEMAKEMLVEILFPALKLAAAKSENKIDDLALAALEGPLKQAALELLEKV
jgi:hypothetical protein